MKSLCSLHQPIPQQCCSPGMKFWLAVPSKLVQLKADNVSAGGHHALSGCSSNILVHVVVQKVRQHPQNLVLCLTPAQCTPDSGWPAS